VFESIPEGASLRLVVDEGDEAGMLGHRHGWRGCEAAFEALVEGVIHEARAGRVPSMFPRVEILTL
jgi:hypothetical protein